MPMQLMAPVDVSLRKKSDLHHWVATPFLQRPTTAYIAIGGTGAVNLNTLLKYHPEILFYLKE